MLEQVVSIIVALLPLFGVIIPPLVSLLMSKLPARQRELLDEVVRTAVNVAEQVGAGQSGPEKKQIAVDAVHTIAASFRLSVNPEVASLLIEAAVAELNAFRAPVAVAMPPVPAGQVPVPQAQVPPQA